MGKHFAVLVLVGMIALVGAIKPASAADAEQPRQATDQERQAAVEIARLGNSSKSECAAAVKALVKIGKPAAPALVKVLSDPRNDVRALAAEALRSILAADPTGAPNCHEKTYWERRIGQLKAGMTLDEALKLLLPELSPAERRKTCEFGMGSGGGSTEIYRLDDYWTVCLYLVGFKRETEKLHDAAPSLSRSVRHVWVALPAKYTGAWVAWYVNGKKSHEIQCRNGKYDGTFTAFYDDGAKCYEQHYTMGVGQGTDTGWYPSGKKRYEGQHEHDKQTGTWRWWKEDGQIESVKDYGPAKQGEKTDN